MTKRLEWLAGAIALGLLLNAAVGFYRILEPAPATAQAALTDVNLVRVGGKPLNVLEFEDGSAALRVIVDRAAAGSQEYPFFVKIAP
jgi:hypothetical protein